MKLTASAIKEIEKQGTAAKKAVQVMKDWMGNRTSGRNLEYSNRVVLGEGEDYTFIAPDGRTMPINMVSERTMGMAKQHGGANYQIGKEVQIPVGAYVVCNRLFLGQKFSTIYHNNGQKAISG